MVGFWIVCGILIFRFEIAVALVLLKINEWQKRKNDIFKKRKNGKGRKNENRKID